MTTKYHKFIKKLIHDTQNRKIKWLRIVSDYGTSYRVDILSDNRRLSIYETIGSSPIVLSLLDNNNREVYKFLTTEDVGKLYTIVKNIDFDVDEFMTSILNS